MKQKPDLVTDVLVVGAGGAGMYAALAAADEGADVLLVDKNVVGRGGATIMAQMTVAAALGDAEPDSWEAHFDDTLKAGRGLCDPVLAQLICRSGPERIRELQSWGTDWAKDGDSIAQVVAPGHDRRRCCYVDFLNTGPAVAATLRKRVAREPRIRRVSNVAVVELLRNDSKICGARSISLADGAEHLIGAGAVVIATGGLTKLYARTSASNNMAGEGYALGLNAGAQLVDMEFVQFFPIGHLAPRLVGMDPIMWDPFRYKLGGRLTNGQGEEFIHRYGAEDGGRYSATRDLATYAITSEVAAGRGTPSGGAYLSFKHLPPETLREAFGPVIDRLLRNGIDLGRDAVEVAPIAHYHMGGLKVDASMKTTLDGLYAAGEAVGGASGANRLSGNAITEALVFGQVAGRVAAQAAHIGTNPSGTGVSTGSGSAAQAESTPVDGNEVMRRFRELRETMWTDVGSFRSRAGLERAIEKIEAHRAATQSKPSSNGAFAIQLLDWYELRSALATALAVATAALAREESRGAHQREDFPESAAAFEKNQVLELVDGSLRSTFYDVRRTGG